MTVIEANVDIPAQFAGQVFGALDANVKRIERAFDVSVISRDSGVPIEDAAWLLKEKVRHFDGEIDIAFTSQENDLGETTTQQGTTFIITANIEEQSTRATIVI